MSLPRTRPRLTTLIVEDSPRLQETLIGSVQTLPGLALAGVADTASDALLAVASHRPDLVILDLSLRGGSGLDVLHAIKQGTPSCCVVVFTGHDTEPMRKRCRIAGADFFFSKNREHREFIAQLEVLSGETD